MAAQIPARFLASRAFMQGVQASRPIVTRRLAQAGKVAGWTGAGLSAYDLHSDWGKYKTPGDQAGAVFCFAISAASNFGGVKGLKFAAASVGAQGLVPIASEDYEFVRTDKATDDLVDSIGNLGINALSQFKHTAPLSDVLAVAVNVGKASANRGVLQAIAEIEVAAQAGSRVEFIVPV